MFFPFQIRSGKRDSDSRPQPWQGCALPTELLPHAIRCEEKETRTPTTQLSLPLKVARLPIPPEKDDVIHLLL